MVPLPYNDWQEESKEFLMQGDVLERTPTLNNILLQYHPYYFENQENLYFIVLTQSCDLVLYSGKRKSKYIMLAPVKAFDNIFKDFIGNIKSKDVIKGKIFVCSPQIKNMISQFIEKSINNNLPEMFYLPKRFEPEAKFAENCSAVLTLTISVKIEHYQTCLDSKLFGLNEVFRAKLGWLTGQIFSRVGTDDLPDEEMRKIIDETLDGKIVEVDKYTFREIKKKFNDWEKGNPDQALEESGILDLIKSVKPRKEEILSAISKVLCETQPIKSLIESNFNTDDFTNKLAEEIQSNDFYQDLNNMEISDEHEHLLIDLPNKIAEIITQSNIISDLLEKTTFDSKDIERVIMDIGNDQRFNQLIKNP